MPLDVCMQAQSQLENHYSTYEQRTLSYHLPFVSNQRLITKQTSPVCVCVWHTRTQVLPHTHAACVCGSMHGDPQEVSQQMFYLQN